MLNIMQKPRAIPSASVLILALSCLVGTTLFGQTRLGIRGGFNLVDATINEEDRFEKIKGKPIMRLHIGGLLEHDASENLMLQTGLIFMGKGTKVVYTDKFFDPGEEYDSEKYTPFYLIVPVHALYQNEKFFFGGGPYFGAALGGKQIVDGIDFKMSFGNSNIDDWRGFDFGLGAQFGLKLNHINLGASLDLGLNSIYPKGWNDPEKPKNIAFSVFATYMFGENVLSFLK
jgi:hypothetical protein